MPPDTTPLRLAPDTTPAATLEDLRARPEVSPRPRRGLTIPEIARSYRVSRDKVRGWIRRGELEAINTASAKCRKPRFVVMPEALEKFEKGRAASDPPKPARRRKGVRVVNFYPD